LRLHFHITALSENDFSRMKQVPISALDKESLKKIYDPQMVTFQKSLIPFIQKVLEVEKINFLAITGSREAIKIEFHDKFELIKQPVFTNLITNVDSFIRKNFHGLSYSLLILDKDGHLEMRLSPRSVDGKGVLEMAGIILKRDPDISFSTEDNSEKITYFKEINKQVCRKFSGFESGNYIDLFEKENIKVLPCKK